MEYLHGAVWALTACKNVANVNAIKYILVIVSASCACVSTKRAVKRPRPRVYIIEIMKILYVLLL